ncbi:MAG: DUF4142 domain-containing protein [Alphaproteobacteria bacterium]|nr:DUF4142 domain-containing protein [Alphaproteobacteria bacterium]
MTRPRAAVLAGLFAAALGLAHAAEPPAQDGAAEFVAMAIREHAGEVRLARLAAERAATPEVRAFAETMLADHRDAKAAFLEVGRALKLRPPRGIADEAEEEFAALSALEGRAFDREFLAYAVDVHESVLADFVREARAGHGEASREAERELAMLRRHLQTARNLKVRLGAGP